LGAGEGIVWFAIRNVYVRAEREDGERGFYERHLLWNARNVEEAFARHEKEVKTFLTYNTDLRRVGETVAFTLGEDLEDLNGAEVWSALGATLLEGEAFYEHRYRSFETQSDDE